MTHTGEQRARALSIWSATSGSAGALGLILGGVITSAVGWRWMLLINVPIGVALWSWRRQLSYRHGCSIDGACGTSAAALLVVPADNSSGHRSPCGAPSSPPRSLAPVDLIDPARRRLFNRAHTTCKACGDQPAAGGRLLHGTAAKTLQL